MASVAEIPIFHAKRAAAVAEEQRVLLVMLSRARHGVVVSRSTTADGRYGPFAVNESRWFLALQGAATMTGKALIAHIKEQYP